MKPYNLLTDNSDYEENVDYDKYIKQIDALFESKVYKEFKKYELREELINFYIESSKYICENIMHIPNDSLLLYLTEEETKKEETKTEDSGFVKWLKDVGKWIENAWKTIWEAIQRIFSKDARNKVASLETKAKQYDELKTQNENLKSQKDALDAKVKELTSSGSINQLSSAPQQVQNVPQQTQITSEPPAISKPQLPSQPQQTNVQTQNTQQNGKPWWTPLSDMVDSVKSRFTPRQGAQQQQSQNPPAASQPTQTQEQNNQGQITPPSVPQSNQAQTVQPQQQVAAEPQEQVQISPLDMITRCYNWSMQIYNRVNVDRNNSSGNSSKNLNPEVEELINSCKSNIIESVDIFLSSKLAQALYNNENSNKIINSIFSFLASNGSKPFSQTSEINGVNENEYKKELLRAKKTFQSATVIMDNITKSITDGLTKTGYDQIYNVMYKVFIKYILIISLILIIDYFGIIFLTNDKSDEINKDKIFIEASITNINYFYSKLAIDNNYIFNYNEIIKLSCNYVDTTQAQFSKILIACAAKACETLSSSSIDDNEFGKVFGSSGCIATIKNLMNEIGFNPNWSLKDSLSMKITESLNAANKNGEIDINNLQKIYTNNTNIVNQLWNKISMVLEQGSKVNFYDGLVSSINEAKDSFMKLGQNVIDKGKEMLNGGKEKLTGVITAIGKLLPWGKGKKS